MESLPVGFRFHPTDIELVIYYLKPKNLGMVFELCVIPEVPVCKHEPSKLPGIFQSESVIKTNGQEEWFFFCSRESKYSNSDRLNRATESGFWKKTGNDLKIMTSGNMIATKKIFVFHTGRGRDGVKTDWVMHEYGLPDQKAFVLCRIRKKDHQEEDYIEYMEQLSPFEQLPPIAEQEEDLTEYMKLPGVRFHPTDEELIRHLKPTTCGKKIREGVIPVDDVCKHEPSDLYCTYRDKSVINNNNQECFFIYSLNSKYSNNTKRKNRETKSGFWKKTGNDLKFMTSGNVIATKKIFVFHTGHGRDGVKTDWVMHEYHLTGTLPNQRPSVLCRLKKKEEKKTKKTKATASDEGEPSSYINVSDVENSRPEFPINNQHNGMQSQFGITEQEEDPIDWTEVYRLAVEEILNYAHACNDDRKAMQSQFDITEEEKNVTEHVEEINTLIDLEKFLIGNN